MPVHIVPAMQEKFKKGKRQKQNVKFTDDEFKLFQAIHKAANSNHPCPPDVVDSAIKFIEAGLVGLTGTGDRNGALDLYVTDEGKRKLILAGRELKV